MPSAIPLSVLDLLITSDGSRHAQTFRNAVDLASHAESWGYRRYWVAEHHLTPGGAGSAPAFVLPDVLRATTTLRVGTAVTVIDYSTPLQVAEVAGTLAALGGDRVDLGLGRGGPYPDQRQRGRDGNSALESGSVAPGPLGPDRLVDGVLLPSPVRTYFHDVRAGLNDRLLSRTPGTAADFGEQVRDVLGFLDGTAVDELGVPIVATPADETSVDVWVHGSSPGLSAQVAGELGLPFGANYHNIPYSVLDTVAAYRAAFVPSARLAAPRVIVSADVVVAETDAEAARIAAPFGPWLRQARASYTSGRYLHPDHADVVGFSDEDRLHVADRLASRIVGSPATVVARLRALVDATSADELVVVTLAHDHADRLRSYQLLAAEWGR